MSLNGTNGELLAEGKALLTAPHQLTLAPYDDGFSNAVFEKSSTLY